MAKRAPILGILDESSFRDVRRLLSENLRDYLPRYLLAFVFMAIAAGGTAGSAWIMKDVVNRVFVNQEAPMLWVLAVSIVALAMTRGVGNYAAAVTLSWIGNSIVARLQRRIYAHVLTLGVGYFGSIHSSELITRLSHNAAAARDVLNTIITSVGRDLLTLIGLLAVMVIQDPLVTILVIAVVPITQAFGTKLVRRVRQVARQGFVATSNIVGVMQESAQGIRLVKAYDLEPLMTGRMNAAIDESLARSNKMASVGARTGPIAETLAGIAVAAVVVWGGYSVIYRGEQPGEFMSFLTAMLLAYEPAKRLARLRMQIEGSAVGARLMFELLDMKSTIPVNEDGPDLVVDKGEVRLEGVQFSYVPEQPLFEGLDFRAEAGCTTALVGGSGAGKSTVMALIERFYDPHGGRVLIDGQDIAKVRLATLRREIALVSQDTFLFGGSIRDNIAVGRPTATDAEIEAAARAAMAHDFILATPNGYHTVVGEHGSRLSGGQRQRIAIARAILKDAKIVLLDEATSALDTESEYLVQVAFERLMRGRTTIVIAHRLSTVLNADRICVMMGGRIVESGKHAELLAAGGHYARLYRLQFEPEARKAELYARQPLAAG